MAKKRRLRKLGLMNPPTPKVIEESEPLVVEEKPRRKKTKGWFSKKKDD